MDQAGSFEPALFIMQIALATAGAALAVRVIDDVRHWVEARAKRIDRSE